MIEAKSFKKTYVTPGLASLLGQSHWSHPALQAGVRRSSVQSGTMGGI